MTSRVQLDRGTRNVLVWCRECPPFRTLTGTPAAAHRVAAEHAARCHGDASEAAEHRRRADELR